MTFHFSPRQQPAIQIRHKYRGGVCYEGSAQNGVRVLRVPQATLVRPGGRVRARYECLGASIYDVRKTFVFFTPSPLVTVTIQLILFLSSAFWGPPSPHPLRTSFMEAHLEKKPSSSKLLDSYFTLKHILGNTPQMITYRLIAGLKILVFHGRGGGGRRGCFFCLAR